MHRNPERNRGSGVLTPNMARYWQTSVGGSQAIEHSQRVDRANPSKPTDLDHGT